MSRVIRKPTFCMTQIRFEVTAKLISAFVFATPIVQSLYFLNPKFQASSRLLWLFRPVCVGPGRKPRRPVFSRVSMHEITRGAAHLKFLFMPIYLLYALQDALEHISSVTHCNVRHQHLRSAKMQYSIH